MDRFNQLKWYPANFQNLVYKFVLRNYVTQSFKDAIAKIDKNTVLTETECVNLLSILFEDSIEMEHLFENPQTVMNNLKMLQNIPNNSNYLGYPNGELNYLANMIVKEDNNSIIFCSKTDAFVFFHNYVIEKNESFVGILMSKSVGNRLNRELENKFEMIKLDWASNNVPSLFQSYCRLFSGTEQNIDELIKNQKNMSFDEIFDLFADSYDKGYDGELLRELKKFLEAENKKCDLFKNSNIPQLFYSQCRLKYALERTFGMSCNATESDNGFMVKYPIVRVFVDNKVSDQKFMMAKELEIALEIVSTKKYGKSISKGLITVETAEDRKLGIIRCVEWKTFERILKILNVSINDLHIIIEPVEQTIHQTQIPINTPYGTYCTLSRHAFFDLFDELIVGMKLFRAINKENCQKVFDWFAQLHNVFDNNRCFYKFPKSFRLFTQKEVLIELSKFSPTFPNQNALQSTYRRLLSLHAGYSNQIDAGMVRDIYGGAIKYEFLEINQRYHQFLEVQEGKAAYDLIKMMSAKMEANFTLGKLSAEYCEKEIINGDLVSKRNTKPIKMSDDFICLLWNDQEFCDIVRSGISDFSRNGQCGNETTEKFLDRKLMNKINEVGNEIPDDIFFNLMERMSFEQ